MARGVLFGHGFLDLNSCSGGYGEMRVYSGGSTPDEMSPTREESYRIARSLGAESQARVVAIVNYFEAEMLPSREGLAFAEQCSGAYIVPEAERDLVSAPGSELLDTLNIHAISVSFFGLNFFFHFMVCFGPF